MTSRALCIHFNWYYKLKYGTNYPISWHKHQGIFKRLMQHYSDEELQQYVRFYLTDYYDRYIEQRGYPIELFAHQLPAIIAQRAAKLKSNKKVSNEDYERIKRAREEE